jgi:arylsulfatase A-like enzyme
MRTLGTHLIAGVVTGLTGLGLAPSAAAETAPCPDCNVVFIVVDSTRADALSCYGDPQGTTPNIDALAQRGQRFEHAFAQGPAALPSVASYLSGRYRLATGMDFTQFKRAELFHPMSDRVTTIAEVLAESGYRTAGVNANSLIARGVDFDLALHQGFETFEFGEDETTTQRAIAQLQVDDERPLFLYMHLMGPQPPNLPSEGFAQRQGEHAEGLAEPSSLNYTKANQGQLTLSEAEIAFWKAAYADALWTADAQVGRLLAAISELGLDDETIVILTSNHGEGLGDPMGAKVRWGHGYGLKPPVLQVPLVIAAPGLEGGVVLSDQVAELVDLAPTITGLLGIPVQDAWHWDGEPLLGPGAVKGRWSISDQGVPPTISANIRTATHSVSGHYEAGEPRNHRFFVLASDPGENTGGVNKAAHTALREALDAYMLDAGMPDAEPDDAASSGEASD